MMQKAFYIEKLHKNEKTTGMREITANTLELSMLTYTNTTELRMELIMRL